MSSSWRGLPEGPCLESIKSGMTAVGVWSCMSHVSECLRKGAGRGQTDVADDASVLWKQDCTCTAGEVKPRCIIAGRACQMHHCRNRAATDVLKCLRQYCCGETGRYKEVSVNWNTQQKHNKGTDTSYPGLCLIKNGIVRNKPSPRTLPPAAPPGRKCPESARFLPKSD